DGTYSIPGLAPGDYRVQVFAEDKGLVGEFYNDTSDWSAAARVTVLESQTTINIDFSLGGGGSLSGTVTDGGGNPVADAWVWADLYDCCGGNGTATGSDGTYSITGLAPGNYRVQVMAQEQGLTSEFYNGTSNWDQAASVAVVSGQDTPNIDFGLSAGGSISGNVSDGTDPIANVWVWADSYDCCGGGNGGETDSSGDYTISGLPTGDFRVQVWAMDLGLVGQFYNNTGDWELADRVTVTADNTTPNIDFVLGAGGSLSGIVLDGNGDPVANVSIWAETFECCSGGNGSMTEADGTYKVDGLAPGDYRVQVFAQELGFAVGYYDGVTDWESANPVTVASGVDTPNIDFALAVGGSISGRVVADSDGVGIAGAWVWAETLACCSGNGAPTNPDGTYTIFGLVPGQYIVSVDAAEHGLSGEFYNNTLDWTAATPVTVTSGGDAPNIDFSLGGGGTITGKVTEADGVTPIAEALVFAEPDWEGAVEVEVMTKTDGTFEMIGLAPGEYVVEAEADGFALEIFNETDDFELAQIVEVFSDGITANVNFTLDVGGTISGTVTNGSTPIAFAEIVAWPTTKPFEPGEFTFDGETSFDGSYDIHGLPAGDYYVFAMGSEEGYAFEFYGDTTDIGLATTVTVVAGQDTPNIDFVLALGGTISGTIVMQADVNTVVPLMGVMAIDVSSGIMMGMTEAEFDGSYALEGLPTGSYVVFTEDFLGLGYIREYYNNVADKDSATPVVVTAEAETSGINFTLEMDGTGAF
ncbi:MAG: carboxypeptidase regulatory-like domain-containing protein, partial [Chloroflexi bacterium]|nr:carboxypeptidase regulatory-like domain-containing protein [Chloroflexota bacterium]